MFFYFPVRKRREEKRRLFLETQTNEMSECSVSLSLSLSLLWSPSKQTLPTRRCQQSLLIESTQRVGFFEERTGKRKKKWVQFFHRKKV